MIGELFIFKHISTCIRIYAVAMGNKNFSVQTRSEQYSDPIVSMAKHLTSNSSEITTGCLKRVQKQLRVENDILTKSGRPVLPLSLRKFVVVEIHNECIFWHQKDIQLIKGSFLLAKYVCIRHDLCIFMSDMWKG